MHVTPAGGQCGEQFSLSVTGLRADATEAYIRPAFSVFGEVTSFAFGEVPSDVAYVSFGQ